MLLVDIGNSRVKWARTGSSGPGPQSAAAHADWGAKDWDRLFAGEKVARVVAVTVAGDPSRRALVDAAARHGLHDVRFYASSAAAGGVRNAYRNPALLGADRWVAVIGAHHSCAGRASCIVDVGTAATVDAVLADGTHLGGFIVPGPRLMMGSLLEGTNDLEAHSAASRGEARAYFANNTRDAIARGCRVALGALVDRAHAELASIAGAPARLLVTGGAAAEVLPHVVAPAEHVPDLVLRGLACLAQEGS